MKKITLFMNSTALAKPVAFDPGKAGWKVDDDGKLVLDANGNPIYVTSDGTEQSVQGETISRLNGEAKSHREAKEAAEAKLAKYKDLDPVKAAEAIATLSKIDQKKLIDAGEVDKVKEEISKGFTEQLAEKDKTIGDLTGNLNGLRLQTAFDGSSFVKERVAVPAEMFRATFGKNFKVEGDKIIPYDQTGNKIYSKKNMGEIASVDEALEYMVEAYPHKDSILKADNQTGSGNNGNGGNGGGAGRRMTRSQFDSLREVQKSETSQLIAKGEVTIVD